MSYTVAVFYVFKCDRCGTTEDLRPPPGSRVLDMLRHLGWEGDAESQICGPCWGDVRREVEQERSAANESKIADLPGSGKKAGQNRGTR